MEFSARRNRDNAFVLNRWTNSSLRENLLNLFFTSIMQYFGLQYRSLVFIRSLLAENAKWKCKERIWLVLITKNKDWKIVHPSISSICSDLTTQPLCTHVSGLHVSICAIDYSARATCNKWTRMTSRFTNGRRWRTEESRGRARVWTETDGRAKQIKHTWKLKDFDRVFGIQLTSTDIHFH